MADDRAAATATACLAPLCKPVTGKCVRPIPVGRDGLRSGACGVVFGRSVPEACGEQEFETGQGGAGRSGRDGRGDGNGRIDADGGREEVRGRGVVGEYPHLEFGESYSYVSYCPMKTSWGTMEGSYTFEREDGSRFDVEIGRFFLVPSAPSLQIESPSL